VVVDLAGTRAEASEILNALAVPDEQGTIVAFAGHGGVDAWLRRATEILLVPSDLANCRGLQVYAHACHTAVEFGPAVVNSGAARDYFGFNEEVHLHYEHKTLVCSEGFIETAAVALEGLASGDSISAVTQGLRSEYSRWIQYWERKSRPVAILFRANLDAFRAICDGAV
jgi:hypothetical protein